MIVQLRVKDQRHQHHWELVGSTVSGLQFRLTDSDSAFYKESQVIHLNLNKNVSSTGPGSRLSRISPSVVGIFKTQLI